MRNPKTNRLSSKLLLAGRLLFAAIVFAVLPASTEAHDPGLSAAQVRVESSRVVVNITLAPADVETLVRLDEDSDGKISEVEFATAKPNLETVASSAVRMRFDAAEIPPSAVTVSHDEQSGAIRFNLRFDGRAGPNLGFGSSLLDSLPAGHRQYVSVHDEDGRKLAEKVLDERHQVFELDGLLANSGAASRAFRDFLRLGIEHILTGYDHLVFLLGLLIAGPGFRQAARIITSFTVAHSITLGLATLGVVRVPAAIVEPLIAVSIIYVGVENIFRRGPAKRWLLTFGFGLVHGFGFASALTELGIARSGAGVAVPLLSFNLGVELGQIAIAVLVLPLIWKVRTNPIFARRLAPVCSVAIAGMGTIWLIARTLSR